MKSILAIYRNLQHRLSKSKNGVIEYKRIRVTEDILQDAVIRFRNFDPSRSNPEAYFYTCLKWGSLDRRAKETTDQVHCISGDSPAHSDDKGESKVSLLDEVPYEEDFLYFLELFDLLKSIVSPDLDLSVVATLLLQGYNQREIAQCLGVKEYTLSRRLSSLRQQLAA